MGKMSKAKGYRGEQELVHKLRAMEYTARRVPLSGGMTSHPGDVIVVHQDVEYLIEVKWHNNGFIKAYDFYEKELEKLDSKYPHSVGFVFENRLVTVSKDFHKMMSMNDRRFYDFGSSYEVVFRRILAWERNWLKQCNFLAIRMNFKDYLFFAYA